MCFDTDWRQRSSLIIFEWHIYSDVTSKLAWLPWFPRRATVHASVARTHARTHTHTHTRTHTQRTRRDRSRLYQLVFYFKFDSDAHLPSRWTTAAAVVVDVVVVAAEGWRGRRDGEVRNAPRGDDAAPDKSTVRGGRRSRRGIRAPAARQRTLDYGPHT